MALQSKVKLELNKLLEKAFKVGASDVHLRVKAPPIFRIAGRPVKTDLPLLNIQTFSST